MYPVLELAKYVVSKCIKDKCQISNLQLQKILYYIQREFLQRLGKPAFTENIEAWPFGPVVPEVYYEFCGAGAMPISLCPELEESFMQLLTEENRRIIDSIIESKRKLNPWDMVSETHKPGGAWDSVYRGGYGNRSTISRKQIRELG